MGGEGSAEGARKVRRGVATLFVLPNFSRDYPFQAGQITLFKLFAWLQSPPFAFSRSPARRSFTDSPNFVTSGEGTSCAHHGR